MTRPSQAAEVDAVLDLRPTTVIFLRATYRRPLPTRACRTHPATPSEASVTSFSFSTGAIAVTVCRDPAVWWWSRKSVPSAREHPLR